MKPRLLPALVAGVCLSTAPTLTSVAQENNPSDNPSESQADRRDGRDSAPVPVQGRRRGDSRSDRSNETEPEPLVPPIYSLTNRTIDGTSNNLIHPEWGSTEEPMLRLAPPAYSDGVGSPAGADRPSPRAISNAVAAQAEPVPNPVRASDYLWQWGQFLDHDIDETPASDPEEPFDIEVPAGDPFFDPDGSGEAVIPLNRSLGEEHEGARQQINAITAFIDASNVYGSDETRAEALRTLDGTGRLKTSAGDLLPFNEAGLPNAGGPRPTLFLAGDVRANEQAGLTAMHTLFVREHNYWADQIRADAPGLTGDEVYEAARGMVAAEMQAITYNEFLPLLLGRNALPRYRGYRDAVNPGISNEFATAAYRLGHSMLSGEILRLGPDGETIEQGNLPLRAAFFNPSIVQETGIDPILRGLAGQVCQNIDSLVVDDVRNFLFGEPGSGGFDLASLNIQRGRDHGLPSYNEVREALGLRPHTSFRGITRNRDLRRQLEEVYGSVDNVDLWVGGLAEDPVRGALVGETFHRILVDQFTRLRDGDRFWYESALPGGLVRRVERQTLAEIIRRNTDIGRELPDNVFVVPRPREDRDGDADRGRGPRR